MCHRRPILTILPGVLVLLAATPAAAVQGHGDPEGLVAHLLGHVLFTGAMLFLAWRLHRRPVTGPGWRAFRAFLVWIILWNILTASGHLLCEIVPPEQYLVSGGLITGFVVRSPWDWYFYCTRLDHLLLLPALACLLTAIKQWRQAS